MNTTFNKALKATILVDSRGRSLYQFDADSDNTPSCYDDATYHCSKAWPPLLVHGAVKAGKGVTASLLKTVKRTDGTVQVTYNRRPLYTFNGFHSAMLPTLPGHEAGDVHGQNYIGYWTVLSPAGSRSLRSPPDRVTSESPSRIRRCGSRTRARFPPQAVLTCLVLPPFRATGSSVAACPATRPFSSRDPDGSGMVGGRGGRASARFGCESGRLMPDVQISPDYETPTAEEFIAEVRRRSRDMRVVDVIVPTRARRVASVRDRGAK